MSSNFIPSDRNQLFLFPPSVDDWLPKNHLARFVVDIVGQLDLGKLTKAYSGRGSAAYHPGVMLALLFYGYATGIFSSRKIETATYDSVAFRFVAVNTHPDHDTIANFRKRFLPQLKPLFAQILTIANEMDILKLCKISLDGTKIKANASRNHALSWKYACKLQKQLKLEVKELLRLAEKADSEETDDGMNIPAELSRREDRLAVIAEAKRKIEERAAERYAQEKKEHDDKMAAREAKIKATGKKPGGRKPKPPEPGPGNKDQVNLTDEDSRIMPTSGKGFEQSYNSQAAVDVETMIIVESHVSQATNDKRELEPALSGLNDLPDELGKVKAILADAGYFSETNVALCESFSIEPYIPPGREKHNQPLLERFLEPEPLPEDADTISKMRHKLKTIEGRSIYGKRKSTVEPVFGIIKHVMGFRQFLLRGFEAVSGEWDLVSIAWNLKRLFVLNGQQVAKGA